MDEITLVGHVEKMWTDHWSKMSRFWGDYQWNAVGRIVCTQYLDETMFTAREAKLIEAELGRRLPQVRYLEVIRVPVGSAQLRVVDLMLT